MRHESQNLFEIFYVSNKEVTLGPLRIWKQETSWTIRPFESAGPRVFQKGHVSRSTEGQGVGGALNTLQRIGPAQCSCCASLLHLPSTRPWAGSSIYFPTTWWKKESEVIQSYPTLCDPMDYSPPGSSVHGDSPGKNTRVGCHFLLQGTFLTQGLNLGPPHCRQTLYPLKHQGSPTSWWVWYKNDACFTCMKTDSHPHW